MPRHTRALAAAVVVTVAGFYAVGHPLALTQPPAPAPPPFARFVDAYLDRFARYHPSIAAGNGIHAHDGQLENFSAASIAEEVGWLRSERRDLDAFDTAPLTPDERVDRRILQGVIDGCSTSTRSAAGSGIR